MRVALKTDGRNVRSQEAIARLGAVREGVLRKHMNVRGYQRDTVYFSILDGRVAGGEGAPGGAPSGGRRSPPGADRDQDHAADQQERPRRIGGSGIVLSRLASTFSGPRSTTFSWWCR